MPKATAGKKKDAMALYDARLAAMAAAATKVESGTGGGGSFISMKAGRLSFKQQPFPENKLTCIVLHAVLQKEHYAAKYDPNNPASPDCYAFGLDADDMAPHEAVDEPYAEACRSCPNNQFGTADTGKGKACADVRRIALISEVDFDNIEGAEIAFCKLAYFSSINWANYVRKITETYNRHFSAFKTVMSVVPDDRSQFRATFEMLEPIEDGEVLGAILDRYDQIEKDIIFPFPKFEAKPEPAKPAPRAARAAAPAPKPVPRPTRAVTTGPTTRARTVMPPPTPPRTTTRPVAVRGGKEKF